MCSTLFFVLIMDNVDISSLIILLIFAILRACIPVFSNVSVQNLSVY